MPVTITLRATKGSPLTTSEMDANLANVKVAVEALETQVNALPEVSDVNAVVADAVSVASLRATLDPVYVDLAGDTMTGALVLSGAPTVDLHAATKKYVDDADVLKAPLASPALTGTPTAPTAIAGTNTTQIATTAYVNTAISTTNGIGSYLVVEGGGAFVGTIGATYSGANLLMKSPGGAASASSFAGTWKTIAYIGETWNSNGGVFTQAWLIQRVA